MPNSITECLNKIEKLTSKNLEILKAINESFYTKKNHLTATIDNVDYVIPSFLSLENKIDSLQQNLENICNAPVTGEATTYFDGTTQMIQLSGYNTTPERLQLNPVNFFESKINEVFKDFMTPVPYIKLDISSIANNTKEVVIKKICLKNSDLQTQVEGASNDGVISYSDLAKILYVYDKGLDYIEYDTTQRLPYRKGGVEGTYSINTIVDNWTDSNFNEFYTLVLDQDLVYHTEEGTIQYDLVAGDKLVTKNGKVQLEITELHPTSKTLTVKVLYGGYANLATTASTNSDLYTLRLFEEVDFNSTKYVEVPLEEDQYICVFIAPINDTTNAHSAWGRGLYIDADRLVITIEGQSDPMGFREFYQTYVNNIGDTLHDITQMVNISLTNLTPQDWNSLISIQPSILASNITVTQINKHLNDSATVKQIRALYNQKNNYKSELDTLQRNIDEINSILSDVSFDDTTNNRNLYVTKLNELNAQKTNITNSIYSISQEMASVVNSADVPIENAKYHIRGFVDCPSQDISGIHTEVIKIDVEYRYKNANKFTGNAETIGDGDYIYSDWNKMDSFYNKKHPDPNSNGSYKFVYDPNNSSFNEPSFNQIDIPITQGESVDIRVRFVYDLGYPFVETLSAWSDIINVVFPAEYVTNVDVLQIINENNDDLKNNYFSSTLNKIGVTEHCDDKIEDQNITYFHTPEHISSGFYTPERRIVPLFDKLSELTDDINDLKNEILGQQSENLHIYITDDQNSLQLRPYVQNQFNVVDYSNNTNKIPKLDPDHTNPGLSNISDVLGAEVAYTQLNLNLFNAGKYNMKLYPMFPGSTSNTIDTSAQSKYNASDYVFGPNYGVWMQLDGNAAPTLQRYNQFVYFRVRDPFTNDKYYNDSIGSITSNKIAGNVGAITPILNENNYTSYFSQLPTFYMGLKYASLFPYIGQVSNICIDSDSQYITIKAGESLTIPLSFYYCFSGSFIEGDKLSVERDIAFDVRVSLYKDPIPFRIRISANRTDAKSLIVKKSDYTLTVGSVDKDVTYSPAINTAANRIN